MSKKFDFAFDVTALDAFTNENTGLVLEAMYSPTTIASGIEVIVGQKGDFTLNTLSNDIYLAAAACGWAVDASTKVTFSNQTVELENLQLKQALCPNDLKTKWVSQIMRAGSNPDEIPFEGFIVEGILGQLSNEIEKMYWRGDKSLGSDNLGLVDGMARFLETAGGSVFVNDASGALTKSTAIAKVDAMIAAIPTEILERNDLVLYVNPGDYRAYVSANAATLTPIVPTDQDKPYGLSLMIPYTNIEMIMTAGLNGVNYMYATSKSNLVFGTDLMSDSENVEIWYSKDNDEYRIKTAFSMGVGAYFPEFVVHNNPLINDASTAT